jgi:hypothetical protein
VDDAHRLRNAHQVESYVDLVPSEDSSGASGGSVLSPKKEIAICERSWCSPRGSS